MRAGQLNEIAMCPQFSQQWRGFRRVFSTGQITLAKGTAFSNAPIYGTLTLLYIIYIYICPIWVIVKETSKGGLFERTDTSFYKCPDLSICPIIH